MSSEIEISGRKIGEEHPPLVIAEIGINHEGSLETAIAMAEAAIGSGAEVIKHQTHVVEDEMSAVAKKVIPGHTRDSIYDIMKRCALSEQEEIELKEYVEQRGAIFISTPFSRAAAVRLEKMGVAAYKIGSGECNNYPLIEHISSYGRPIILSTGMNTIESIGRSVDIFRKYKIPYALLHCTNVYPTPPSLVRLGGVTQLREAFSDAVVGLSDHTTSNYPCLGAVALGASMLERHFTDSKDRAGPDIICSMDGQDLQELIRGARIIFEARGGAKGPVEAEGPTIDFAFASVVTIAAVKKGERFNRDNLWVKRPGTGDFKAVMYEELLGRTAARDIDPDTLLTHDDIEGESP
jgi:N-acetylneuraminate synthase